MARRRLVLPLPLSPLSNTRSPAARRNRTSRRTTLSPAMTSSPRMSAITGPTPAPRLEVQQQPLPAPLTLHPVCRVAASRVVLQSRGDPVGLDCYGPAVLTERRLVAAGHSSFDGTRAGQGSRQLDGAVTDELAGPVGADHPHPITRAQGQVDATPDETAGGAA